MSPTEITHSFAVFGLFGLIWTIQLVHYPMFKLIEAPHWPRFHRYHSRNITFIVFPLMLIELLTSLQFLVEERNSTNVVAIACAAATWAATILIFLPLHHKIAHRPTPKAFDRLTRLNWIRTLIWTLAAGNVLSKLFNPA